MVRVTVKLDFAKSGWARTGTRFRLQAARKIGRQERSSLNQLVLTEFLARPKHGKPHLILGLFLLRNPKKTSRSALMLVWQPPEVTPSYVVLSCHGSHNRKHNKSDIALLSNRPVPSSVTQTFTWLNAWHFYPISGYRCPHQSLEYGPYQTLNRDLFQIIATFVGICLLLNRFSNHFPEAMRDSKAQVLCCHLARFENSRPVGIK